LHQQVWFSKFGSSPLCGVRQLTCALEHCEQEQGAADSAAHFSSYDSMALTSPGQSTPLTRFADAPRTLWMFADKKGGRAQMPRSRSHAQNMRPANIKNNKRRKITAIV